MKRLGRRWASGLLTLAMLVGLMPWTAVFAGAADTEWTYGVTETVSGGYTVDGTNYSLIRGVYRFPSAVGGLDLPAAFFYSDGFFAEDAYTYNDHLATTSLNMAMSAFYANDGGTGTDGNYGIKSEHIGQFLMDVGCDRTQIYMNHYNRIRPQTDSIGVTIAQKPLKTADGTPTGRILVPIAIRGANYEKEWASNVTLGDGSAKGGEALGFATAANEVFREVRGYLKDFGLEQAVADGRVDFWIAGYSRAGATTNLTSRRLVDAYAQTRESGNRVFAYCVEAPQGGWKDAETAGNDYTCIHSVINKSDLVPRVAPGAMSFRRYGVDHYLPGDAAGTLGEVSDNDAYAVGSWEYDRLKPSMLTHLHAVNPDIVFSDEFQVYGLDSSKLKMSLSGGSTGLLVFLAYSIGTFLSGNAEDIIIHKDASVSMDAFLDEFFANLCAWTEMTRGRYADNSSGSCVQTAARDYMAIVFDSSPEELRDFKEALIGLWDNDQVGILDLLGIFYYAFGEWHKPDFEYKSYYTEKLVNWMKDSGAYDKLNLSEEEKDQLMTKDLPVLADFLMTYLSADYQNELHNASGMTQTLTFLANAENIMSNHYPEVNLAWLRAQDSLYQNETEGVSLHIPQQLKEVSISLNGAEWMNQSPNEHDISEKALRNEKGGLTITVPGGLLYGTHYYYRFSNEAADVLHEIPLEREAHAIRVESLNGTGHYTLEVVRQHRGETDRNLYFLNVVEETVSYMIVHYENGEEKTTRGETSENTIRLSTELPKGEVFDRWVVYEQHGDGSMSMWGDWQWKDYELYERNAEINVGSAEWLPGDSLSAYAYFRQAPNILCTIQTYADGVESRYEIRNHGTPLQLKAEVPGDSAFDHWEITETHYALYAPVTTRSYTLNENPVTIDLGSHAWIGGGELEAKAILRYVDPFSSASGPAMPRAVQGKASTLLTDPTSPVIVAADVTLDLPRAGAPLPKQVEACVVRMEDGGGYSIDPKDVLLDWLVDGTVQYADALADTPYTARVRFADERLLGTWMADNAAITLNGSVTGKLDSSFNLLAENKEALAAGYQLSAVLRTAAAVPAWVHEPDTIYLDHGATLSEDLPATLPVRFSDGTEGDAPVTWDLENAAWQSYDRSEDEWYDMGDYDPNEPGAMWTELTGTVGGVAVSAEVYVCGLPCAAPPAASHADLEYYNSPIRVELHADGVEDQFILYTLDGSNPRHSDTVKCYKGPILLGDTDETKDVCLIAYVVSPDGYWQYDDSEVIVWHYAFNKTITGVFSDGAIRWRLAAGAFTGAGRVVIATYDAQGRMLDCKTAAVTDLSAGAEGAERLATRPGGSYKVMLVGDGYAPLCAAWSGET